MVSIEQKFAKLGIDDAPGQEVAKQAPISPDFLRGDNIGGVPVDFSHGDVGAFPPPEGALPAFIEGVSSGGAQAYTEYRGAKTIRDSLARRLERHTGAPVSGDEGLIVTPGTQGALFLAVCSTATTGAKVAVVKPDYFANRKLVEFVGARISSLQMNYSRTSVGAGIDLDQVRDVFLSGVRLFVFSNPNNPVGAVYSREEIVSIASLATEYGVTVIVDELYARLLYPGTEYTHLRAVAAGGCDIITICGPSKTESLSGYRLGVALGPKNLIDRMERLQAIVSLRAAGYNQAVLETWLTESDAWLADRISRHRAIRDDLIGILRGADGVIVRSPAAGSYLFPRLPALSISVAEFVAALRLQANVIVMPGHEFDPDCKDSIRLNFSQGRANAVDGAKRICALIERYRAS